MAFSAPNVPDRALTTLGRRHRAALLLIIDDAVSAEGPPVLIAGLGPQAVALI